MKKDTENGMFFGVCAGIAKELEFDVTFVRLAFALAFFMGFGVSFLVYIILAFCMPEK